MYNLIELPNLMKFLTYYFGVVNVELTQKTFFNFTERSENYYYYIEGFIRKFKIIITF